MFIFWDPIASMGFDIGASIPIVVVWLVFGALFFTLKMNFINIRAFKHAIDLVRGKYDDPNDQGEVSHFQALLQLYLLQLVWEILLELLLQ